MPGNIVRIDPWNPDRELIARAAMILAEGGLVAFPTETVYGLGGDGLDPEAAKRIYSAKGRPSENPLILHVASLAEADSLADVTPNAAKLMEHFWPGPLTIVLHSKAIVPLAVRGGLETVAIRMPAHPVALSLIEKAGFPIAAPSANRSGRPSPTEAKSVLEDLGGNVDLILDGGPTRYGVESTVIDVTGNDAVLLRPGGTSVEDLTCVVGPVCSPDGEHVLKRSPGTRFRHYAPGIPLLTWRDGEEIRFPSDEKEKRLRVIAYMGMRRFPEETLQSIYFEDPENYARGLFSAMRELERSGAEFIVAEWPEVEGVGRAIQDRLRRASARR